MYLIIALSVLIFTCYINTKYHSTDRVVQKLEYVNIDLSFSCFQDRQIRGLKKKINFFHQPVATLGRFLC